MKKPALASLAVIVSAIFSNPPNAEAQLSFDVDPIAALEGATVVVEGEVALMTQETAPYRFFALRPDAMLKGEERWGMWEMLSVVDYPQVDHGPKTAVGQRAIFLVASPPPQSELAQQFGGEIGANLFEIRAILPVEERPFVEQVLRALKGSGGKWLGVAAQTRAALYIEAMQSEHCSWSEPAEWHLAGEADALESITPSDQRWLLGEFLNSRGERQHREALLSIVEQIPGREITKALMRELLDADSPEGASALAAALKSRAGEDGTDASEIGERLRAADLLRHKRNLLVAAGVFGSRASGLLPEIAAASQDHDEEIAREGVRALGRLSDPLAYAPIKNILSDPHRSRALKVEAVKALGWLDTEESRGVLVAISESPDPYLRRAAQDALSHPRREF